MSARDDFPVDHLHADVRVEIERMYVEVDRLRRIESAAKVLTTLVPGHWWTTPPNQATADVMQGIKSLGIDPNHWREVAP
jgi:hypothetical protein